MGEGGKRVLVVGAGSSGLTAIKACLEEGLLPVCLEKTLQIGGLWNYRPDPSPPGTAAIYRSLVINTCREMMAFSDFPAPRDAPHFLTHRNVMRYFASYARRFSLLPHVRFNTEVRHVRPADDYDVTGRWLVTYVTHVHESCPMNCVGGFDLTKELSKENDNQTPKMNSRNGTNGNDYQRSPDKNAKERLSELRRDDLKGSDVKNGGSDVGGERCREVTEEYDAVMVCSGHHTVPYLPELPGMADFQGRLLHSQQYRTPEAFAGQRVLVLGIGNSAVDIASDLAKTADKVYLSTRRGAWVVGRSAVWGIPADMLANSRVMSALPASLLQWLVEVTANLRMDHYKLGLAPKHRLLGAHPTINDELPFQLMNGRIEVRPHVARILSQAVQFQNGQVQEVDAIILATGYDYRLDFVDPEVVKVRENRVRLFKFMFPPHLPHPTLGLVGLVQAIGAVMPIAELQCRWFVNLLLGRVKLPPQQQMERDIDRKQRTMDSQYYMSRRHTLQTPWIDCMDEVAAQFGARPNLKRLFFTDPGLALRCFFGPCLPAQYRLQGPNPWPLAPAFIKDVWARSSERSKGTRDPAQDVVWTDKVKARGGKTVGWCVLACFALMLFVLLLIMLAIC